MKRRAELLETAWLVNDSKISAKRKSLSRADILIMDIAQSSKCVCEGQYANFVKDISTSNKIDVDSFKSENELS